MVVINSYDINFKQNIPTLSDANFGDMAIARRSASNKIRNVEFDSSSCYAITYDQPIQVLFNKENEFFQHNTEPNYWIMNMPSDSPKEEGLKFYCPSKDSFILSSIIRFQDTRCSKEELHTAGFYAAKSVLDSLLPEKHIITYVENTMLLDGAVFAIEDYDMFNNAYTSSQIFYFSTDYDFEFNSLHIGKRPQANLSKLGITKEVFIPLFIKEFNKIINDSN